MKKIVLFVVALVSFGFCDIIDDALERNNTQSNSTKNLYSLPCKYITPGEVLESYKEKDVRVCVVNISRKSERNSYLIFTTLIFNDTSKLVYTSVIMPMCVLGKVVEFQNNYRTEYFVDTLNNNSYFKRLYNRSCE